MSKDINAILAGMADGHIHALGELYAILSVRIFNYARAVAKNREAAEDITHNVFMQVLKQAARLSKMENPAAYIMVITRNQSYDYLKRGKRMAAALDDVPEMSDSSLPINKLVMEDAFSTLPDNQRETIYLHFVCGYTQKEVAGMMGAPLVTVKWRCKKALAQLQAYFNPNKEGFSHDVI